MPPLPDTYAAIVRAEIVEVEHSLELLRYAHFSGNLIIFVKAMQDLRDLDGHVSKWLHCLGTSLFPAALVNMDWKEATLRHMRDLLVYGGCVFHRRCVAFGLPPFPRCLELVQILPFPDVVSDDPAVDGWGDPIVQLRRYILLQDEKFVKLDAEPGRIAQEV